MNLKVTIESNTDAVIVTPGTLRDWFAGQAIPGIMRTIDEAIKLGRIDKVPDNVFVARCAYQTADAMLAERKKHE
jgi:hypothetical protein